MHHITGRHETDTAAWYFDTFILQVQKFSLQASQEAMKPTAARYFDLSRGTITTVSSSHIWKLRRNDLTEEYKNSEATSLD
jgi:hypothetical protein